MGPEAGPGHFARVSRSIPLPLLWIFERADLKGRICEDLESQLEDLDLFRLEAERLQLWTWTDPFSSWEELASLGLDRLKSALMALGLKCGGTLEERAQRLFSTKGLCSEVVSKRWGRGYVVRLNGCGVKAGSGECYADEPDVLVL